MSWEMGCMQDTPYCLDLLMEEAIVGHCVRHPSIIVQHGVIVGSWNGQPCITGLVQEYMAGGSLASALEYASPTTGPASCQCLKYTFQFFIP